MIKPIYGLKDAPRAWRKKLHLILTSLKGRSLKADSAIYVFYVDGSLCCIVSTHVDDLKIAGDKVFVATLIKDIEKQVGKLKIQTAYCGSFEHCGIIHSQTADYTVTIHQNHYVLQLRPVNVSEIDVSRPLTPLNSGQVALYLSLLGALSWLSQTRLDVAIYVQSLQRNAKSPLVEHLLRLNKVCKWVRRKPSFIRYERLEGETKLVAIADSAFRKEDKTGLAMRGAIIAVAESHQSHPGGRIHLIEYYSRKQRRVTRSTFAAELHSLIDAVESAKVISHAFAELMSAKPLPPAELIALEESGNLPIAIHACVDAQSVFDALKSADTRAPLEGSLVMCLLQLKEQMRTGTLTKLWWIDTLDMLADGLNKGCVSRAAILTACATGKWELKHKCMGHVEPSHEPLVSARQDVENHMHSESYFSKPAEPSNCSALTLRDNIVALFRNIEKAPH